MAVALHCCYAEAQAQFISKPGVSPNKESFEVFLQSKLLAPSFVHREVLIIIIIIIIIVIIAIIIIMNIIILVDRRTQK